MTFLPSPLGSWPPGRRAGSKLEYLRFLGRPGPRRAGLLELSSLLAAEEGWSEAYTHPGSLTGPSEGGQPWPVQRGPQIEGRLGQGPRYPHHLQLPGPALLHRLVWGGPTITAIAALRKPPLPPWPPACSLVLPPSLSCHCPRTSLTSLCRGSCHRTPPHPAWFLYWLPPRPQLQPSSDQHTWADPFP